jgi:hypothetical protein
MDIVATICALPVQFKEGNLSIWQLVKKSGYRDDPSSLTVDAVATHLREHPELIDAWLGYSQDKRCSGWFVRQSAVNTYEVGYVPGGERISMSDPARACAEFIVREVRSIAG